MMMFSDHFIYKSNSSKSPNIQFTIIKDEEKTQMLIFEKPGPPNVWDFSLKNNY